MALAQWAVGQPAHSGSAREIAARLGLSGVPGSELRLVTGYPMTATSGARAALLRITDLRNRHIGLEVLLLQGSLILEHRLVGRIAGGFTVLRPPGARLTVAPTLELAADAPGYGVVSAVTPENLAEHWLPPAVVQELTIVCDAATEAAAWAAADRLQSGREHAIAVQCRMADGSRLWLADRGRSTTGSAAWRRGPPRGSSPTRSSEP